MIQKRKFWHWAILALLSLIWGSSYILMKKGLQSFSPYQVGSLRILITAIALLPVAIKNLPRLNRNNIASVLIIGYAGNAIPAFLFPAAQTHISSSLTGMLNTLSPVFTLLIGIIIYKREAIRSQIAGVILGLAGAAGLLYSGSFTINWFGLFVVAATILNGISNNEVSRTQGLNGIRITALAFFLSLPLALIYLPFSHMGTALHTANALRNLGFITILSIVGSALAQGLYYMLIRDTSPVFATIVTYFIPVVATMWGILDGEALSASMFSVVFILAGVYFINSPALFRRKLKPVRDLKN
jgi:drug/metabolite transporter (DMT)-like permease